MGPLRRFWARRLGKVVVIAALALVVFIGLTLSAAAYTERNNFCIGACHEMQPYGDTWVHSRHKDIDCVRCHIKPGVIEFTEAKLSALREVWVHLTGQVKKPIAVTERILNSTCGDSGCHPDGSVADPLTLRDKVPFSHKGHPKVALCITCHSQVVHRSVPGRPYIDPTTMAYCLACHDGKQAADGCETCHEPPHEARGRCTDCHDLGSWKSTFKHPVKLVAPHRKAVCETCHTDSTATNMGPAGNCVGCHGNHHRDQNTKCVTCHTITHWVPSTFRHPRSGCTDCHKRPHADRGDCLRCHTTSSWASRFAHPIALGGVHATFPCERCHTSGLNAPGRGCSSCHGSNHGGLTNCAQCHSTSAWVPSTFSHPPAGEHSPGSMACTSCHPGGDFTRANCTCHGGKPPNGD